VKWGRGALTLLLAAYGVGTAQAAQWSVSAGASVSQKDWTPAVAVDVAGDARDFGSGRLQWRPVAALTAVAAREASWRPGNDRDVWVATGGAALSLRDSGWFFAFQAGAADRTTPALSSHLQFVSSLGWQGQRLRVQLRHISNGRIGGGANLGESMLLLGVRL
jgi:hypothetical protein